MSMLEEVSIIGEHDGVSLVQVESSMSSVIYRRLEVYEEYPIMYLTSHECIQHSTCTLLQETSKLRLEDSRDVERSLDRTYISPAMICWTIVQLHSQL
jgi:hypothetical protein